MTARQRRMFLVGLIVLGVAGAVVLARTAFKENMLYFYSPSDLAAAKAPPDRLFRLGGMVSEGSFKRPSGSMEARFVVTDFQHDVTVSYTGLLPDLFREGQGVIARGHLGSDGVFVAEEVLAKHDENYMPPDVADSLRKQHAKKAPVVTQPALSSGEGA
jgi:cytochrome c-type biogenesis protein CcmE